nr:UBX domain-containing protein 4 [Neodiprion pinetum]
MKWFEGNITEAVAASKSRKAIFVVFVEGKDDASSKIAKVIDSEEISSRLERDDFVAVKLEGGSESYGFFTQIYQLVPIPSMFFIGQNGTPIEIIAGETSVADLTSKIDTILKKADPTSKDSSTSFIQAEQKSSAGSTSSLKNSETEISAIDLEKTESGTSMAPIPATSQQLPKEEIKIDNEDKTAIPDILETEIKPAPAKLDSPSTSQTATEATNKPELTAEEKVERARRLIELQKRQRDEEEARKVREREIERRKTGQEMLKIKQKQQELEIKQAYDERMKEKAAEAAAREKVRQQIMQDKLERKQRELDQQRQYGQQTPIQEQPKPRTPLSSDSGIVRIQFRPPSGNPHMGQFESTSTLGALRSYVLDNIELPFRQFALSTSFPRRDLTVDDDAKTLLELELVPTAVILILPLRNTNSTTAVTSAQDDGYLSRLMWAIFAGVLSVYGYIKGYFTGPPASSAEHQSSSSTSGGVHPTASNTDSGNSEPSPSVAAGLLRRNIGGQGSATIRTQGNVHRLHSGGDPDNDENNTWNGNSTQQM